MVCFWLVILHYFNNIGNRIRTICLRCCFISLNLSNAGLGLINKYNRTGIKWRSHLRGFSRHDDLPWRTRLQRYGCLTVTIRFGTICPESCSPGYNTKCYRGISLSYTILFNRRGISNGINVIRFSRCLISRKVRYPNLVHNLPIR